MILTEILRRAFASAYDQPGRLIVDIFWKFLWFFISVAGVYVALASLMSGVLGIEWDDIGNPELNRMVALSLLNQFWSSNRELILLTLLAMLAWPLLVWLLMEAAFRQKLAGGPFLVLLASNAFRSSILGAGVVLLLFVAARGAPVLAVTLFAALAFIITVLDTLIRADAVDLLGTDLFRVSGLIGILLFLELMVGSTLFLLVDFGLTNAADGGGAVVLLGGAAAVVLMSVLHSYLLIVRFSAIAIMRRNVIEV